MHDDAFVETFADTIFFMLPTNLISYVYGSADHGIKLVNYEIKTHGNSNALKVRIIDPIITSNQKSFEKIIEPQHLFKYLKYQELDFENDEYEMALNPIRYRHVVITSILKQYIRENMFIGELEVESDGQVTGKSSSKNLGAGSSMPLRRGSTNNASSTFLAL